MVLRPRQHNIGYTADGISTKLTHRSKSIASNPNR